MQGGKQPVEGSQEKPRVSTKDSEPASPPLLVFLVGLDAYKVHEALETLGPKGQRLIFTSQLEVRLNYMRHPFQECVVSNHG